MVSKLRVTSVVITKQCQNRIVVCQVKLLFGIMWIRWIKDWISGRINGLRRWIVRF